MKNTLLSFLFTMILAAPLPGLAKDTQYSNLKIDAQWNKGTVVNVPYQADHLRMKVDRVTYIVMKGCKVFKRETSSEGNYQETTIDTSEIRKGDKVLLRAHGNRIFQIIVFE